MDAAREYEMNRRRRDAAIEYELDKANIAERARREAVDSESAVSVRSYDPNEKVGPAGYSDEWHDRVVKPGDMISYTIYFENDPEFATAPAQEVFVTDQLSAALDWSTFELTEVVWGNHSVTIAPGTANASFKEVISDWRPEENKGWWVDGSIAVGAGGTLLASFRTLDPDTDDLPLDPFAGFLPVNDDTGRGEGHISFTIRVREDASTPQRLENYASIVFDTNAPLVTDTVWNTIDEINRPPTLLNPGDQASEKGAWVRLALVGKDPDADTLVYSATGLPDGLSIHPNTGIIAGRISLAEQDRHVVTASVSDGSFVSNVTFVWTGRPDPDPDADADGDGMPDWWELLYGLNRFDGTDAASDPDGDGVDNLQEFLAGSSPCDPDTDDDDMPDGWEIAHMLDPASATGDDGADGDPDADRLNNAGEYEQGTHPQIADTDGGGELDGPETFAGRNPLDRNDDWPYDVNYDGNVDALDVQLTINGALRLPVPFLTDVTGDNATDALDVQLVINAALRIL